MTGGEGRGVRMRQRGDGDDEHLLRLGGNMLLHKQCVEPQPFVKIHFQLVMADPHSTDPCCCCFPAPHAPHYPPWTNVPRLQMPVM